MEKEIVNRVAQSKLVTFDLEDFYPEGERIVLDIKDWLYEDIILREKEFRTFIDSQDWRQYKGAYIALTCSSDAIIPGWAYMLVTSRLTPFVKKVMVGNLEQLESAIYQTILENLDISEFENKPVIIKGCANKPVPQNAYLMAMAKIQAVAKSVMYGEACSSVPLFKRK
ncbi:DUF2480 family protein [Croceitalea rosinachiae]|uniref:DUF2480 family protein n=1 Tax=Croceitalea rosinachiae TaxID=3075596 RepID=A0ABU3A7J3_9FLAO|nr:DUF2480 family protein [Croceitalea sp. F388]MDT0606146.1 DUF2480 family protein [Croceitalea sp. F388]